MGRPDQEKSREDSKSSSHGSGSSRKGKKEKKPEIFNLDDASLSVPAQTASKNDLLREKVGMSIYKPNLKSTRVNQKPTTKDTDSEVDELEKSVSKIDLNSPKQQVEDMPKQQVGVDIAEISGDEFQISQQQQKKEQEEKLLFLKQLFESDKAVAQLAKPLLRNPYFMKKIRKVIKLEFKTHSDEMIALLVNEVKNSQKELGAQCVSRGEYDCFKGEMVGALNQSQKEHRDQTQVAKELMKVIRQLIEIFKNPWFPKEIRDRAVEIIIPEVLRNLK